MDWIRKHVTAASNTGLRDGGYYYYCYQFTSTMTILEGLDSRALAGHPLSGWRSLVIDALLQRQKDGNHWQNTNPLWLEKNPELCTAYAIKSLILATKE